ncbi:MAG: hypothetical protein Q8P13_00655 [bacterium]|nr:hypothetical protein [bacterium]
MISKNALEKFKNIYKLEFGSELSDQEAADVATDFLALMREIVEPIPNGGKHGSAKKA